MKGEQPDLALSCTLVFFFFFRLNYGSLNPSRFIQEQNLHCIWAHFRGMHGDTQGLGTETGGSHIGEGGWGFQGAVGWSREGLNSSMQGQTGVGEQ